MTTRARVDRAARRIAARVPTAAAGGVCRCPVDRIAVRIDLGDGDQLADQVADPCPRCGGLRPIVILDLANGPSVIAARDAVGRMREIARLGVPTDDL